MPEWVTEIPDLSDFNPQSPPRGAWVRDDGREVVIGAAMWEPLYCVCALGVGMGFSYFAIGGWTPPISSGGLLFLIPWTLATVFILSLALLAWAGHQEVRILGEKGEVFTGIGPLGIRRSFTPGRVLSVEMQSRTYDENVSQRIIMYMQNGRTLTLGRMIPYPRLRFVAAGLRMLLAANDASAIPAQPEQ